MTPDQPTARLAGAQSSLQVAQIHFVLGMDHILVGFDHLVFVLALVLLIQDRWMLLKTVTAFKALSSRIEDRGSRIEEMVTDGADEIWVADEYDVSGGHVVTQLDARASTLDATVKDMRALWTAIANTLDTANALVVASNLASE